MGLKTSVHLIFFQTTGKLCNLLNKVCRLKKYAPIALLIILSWAVLFFIYNYRNTASHYGMLIPGFMTAVVLINAWLFNYILIPGYYFRRKYIPFIFFTLSAVILSTWLQMLFVFGLYMRLRFELNAVTPRLQDIMVIISSTWLIVLGSIAISKLPSWQTMQGNRKY